MDVEPRGKVDLTWARPVKVWSLEAELLDLLDRPNPVRPRSDKVCTRGEEEIRHLLAPLDIAIKSDALHLLSVDLPNEVEKVCHIELGDCPK